MRRSTTVTLQDVAREVGVSAMTVSVVLHGNRSTSRVSDATRERILEAATRLRYRPNAVARGLSRRRMDTIGVVAVIDGGELNLYFLELLNGVLEGAAKHGQNTTIFSVSPDWTQNETRILEFCDGRVDGMVFIAPRLSPAFAETLQHHTPFVTLHSNRALPGIYDLEVDDEGGAYCAVRHLIEHGHRRILHFTGQLELTGAQQRLAGYRRALEEAGIPCDEALVIPCGFSSNTGRGFMGELLDSGRLDPLPTAIFGANDAIASGCLEAMAIRGLRAPDHLSVVGFDDTLAARTTVPPLTTIRQPFRDLGYRAVDLLLGQIQGDVAPAAASPRTEVFDVELVTRGSVGPPPDPPVSLSSPSS